MCSPLVRALYWLSSTQCQPQLGTNIQSEHGVQFAAVCCSCGSHPSAQERTVILRRLTSGCKVCVCMQFHGEQQVTRGHMSGWRRNQAWTSLLQTQKVCTLTLHGLPAYIIVRQDQPGWHSIETF